MKKILILLLTAALAFAMVACGDSDEDTEEIAEEATEEVMEEEQNTEKSVDAVAEALGLEGGEETMYNAIGAIDGKEFNDGTVEIYLFDENSAEYEAIDETETINGIQVWENDGMVLMFPAGQEPDQVLIDKFEALDFD